MSTIANLKRRRAKRWIATLGFLVLALLISLPGVASGPQVRVSYIEDVREWIQKKAKTDLSALHPTIKWVEGLQFLDPRTGWMILHPVRNSDFIRLGLVPHLVRIDNQMEETQLFPRLNVPGRFSIWDVSFISERTGWALVGQDVDDERGGIDFIYHTEDGGQTWVRQPGVRLPKPIRKIQFIDSQSGWALYEGGYLYITDDGGFNWEEVPIKWGEMPWGRFEYKYEEFRYFLDMQFVSQQEGWLSGKGLILHTRDGGHTWEAQYDATRKNPSHIDALFFLNEKEGWACGVDSKRLLHTVDGGLHWQEIRLNVKGMGPFDAFWDIFFLNPKVGIISGQHHEMEELSQKELERIKKKKVKITPNTYAYSHAYILYTLDGGKSWSSLPIKRGIWKLAGAGNVIYGLKNDAYPGPELTRIEFDLDGLKKED